MSTRSSPGSTKPEAPLGTLVVDDENMAAWKEMAVSIRLFGYVLKQVGDPLPGSKIHAVNLGYPYEFASDWCRGFLSAASEHLDVWANIVMPFSFHEGAVAGHALRPVQTLSRASMEAASQAIWVMGPTGADESLYRHLALVVNDFDEQAKAAGSPQRRLALAERKSQLLERVHEANPAAVLPKFGGYGSTLRDAAVIAAGGENAEATVASAADRIWRASAGSSHGKRWPTIELQHTVLGVEYAPGQHRATSYPEAGPMTAVVSLASDLFACGVMMFVDQAGFGPNLPEIRADGLAWLRATLPRESTA